MIDEVGEGLAEETRTLAERLFSILPPAFRPRTLALGQAVMQRPTFSTSKTMLKNLLSFNALLDQYSMAAGSPMAEDLIVGTVFRCIDPVTRKHLQYNMPDVALGTTTAGGPRPMDVDNVALRERANIKESRRARARCMGRLWWRSRRGKVERQMKKGKNKGKDKGKNSKGKGNTQC